MSSIKYSGEKKIGVSCGCVPSAGWYA